MSNFCDVNLTVKNCCADAITDYINSDKETDLFEAFGDENPDIVDGGVQFWGKNAISWGIDTHEMIAISKAFPEAVFTLWSRNENNSEWLECFKNGRMAEYEPIITWPEFNEADLKEVE